MEHFDYAVKYIGISLLTSRVELYAVSLKVKSRGIALISSHVHFAASHLVLRPPTMSDKIKEFIEIPQQFIRDGNQVRSMLLKLDSCL